MVEFIRLRQMGMKRPKRPTESKSGKVFQTGNLAGLLVEWAARSRVRKCRVKIAFIIAHKEIM